MWRFILALVLLVHGLAHLMGVWEHLVLPQFEAVEHEATLLAGQWDVGATAIRGVGLLWLTGAIGFVVAAIGIANRRSWGRTTTLYVAILSLFITVLAWPPAVFGIYTNIAILIALLFVPGHDGGHASTVL